MRLESLRIKGLGPFKNELAIDFADYAGAKLIAITGDNGAGKTTMLELALPGSMYRSTPTRGSLTDLATTRDAMLEVRIVNGQPWTLRHLVDGVSGKSEALVMDVDGRAVVDSGKVRHFDVWAAKHLPAPEVLFTSCFGAQGADGFVGLKPGERKAVLLRCLGVERYEGLAERARERAKAQRLKIETLDARLADERARQTGNAAAALEGTRLAVADIERLLAAHRVDLAAAEAEVQRVAELERAEKDARARRAELEGRLAAERAKLSALETKIANNREVLRDKEAIREAEALSLARVQQMESLRRELAELRGTIAGVDAQTRSTKQLLEGAMRERAAAEQRCNAARARLANEKQIRAAAALMPQREGLVDQTRAQLEKAEKALAALQGKRVAGAEERLVGLRMGLTAISELDGSGDVGQPASIAGKTLVRDDLAERESRETPALVSNAEQNVRSLREQLAVNERLLREAEQLAARAPELAGDKAELAAATEAWEQASAGMAQDRERAATLATEFGKQSQAILYRVTVLAQYEAEQPKLLDRASLAAPLANAQARLSELEPQHQELAAAVAELVAQVSATPAPPTPPAAPDVAAYRKAVSDCERGLREAAAAVAVAQQRVADEQASLERLRVLESERAGLDDELADWTRLAADLGRDGLQAMVIDAAIPELNHTANELLHEAFGPRWTIDIRTQATDAKGKRMLETLDVVVIDTQAGREGLAESLSGGERVIVQEAISLALTVLACRQSGVERPTLVRDESGAALAEGRAPQWIAMLRRAVDLIGADKCLFVSHTPATWELADARIHLGGAA